MHNHSTWGNVAVGMIGLVMDDKELINRSLYGLDKKDVDLNEKDNDGGFIYDKEGKAGFLANVDSPFSPDGFYTEGPYYQRYAMYPFLIFAEALQNKKPELKIFEYKNGVLIKAVNALLNLTDADGDFFPLNDGQKGMSYFTPSLISAVDIAYYYGDQDPRLLSVAKKQGAVQLDATGLKVALALKEGKEKPFVKESMELSDGANGDEGGIGILRFNNEEETLALVFKYAAQGLSHGHYDKLSFSLYENGDEVLQAYGLSRFVNVEQKNGGGYLKENKTYAKHTIAHNTIVQNETSHFNYDFATGSKYHPEKFLFDISNPNFQIASAKEQNAYPGSEIHRTMIMVKDEELEKPFIIDLSKIQSNNKTIDNQNNYGSQSYDGLINKIGNYKFSKLENINQLNFKPIFLNDGLIFFDKKGSIVRYNNSQKTVWRKNYYSKREKKLKPQLNFLITGDNLLVVDNIAKYYSVNINSGNLNWSKNNNYPFNSEIKKNKDKFFVVDYKNTLRCYKIDDGSECWNLQT